jgi:serine/threonine protein kinase/tetratricopeptide (TPR) repeat protein
VLTASTRLGPYVIIAPLGAGGMGEVYCARDARLGRDVAVKILPELLASDPGRRARFDREIRAVAALSHPNILAIYDCGTEGEISYAVMELLEGETLRSRIAKGPLTWREAVELGAAIAEGLAAAHSKGIIHRDIKPENLFLTADGRVKILDFGLALFELCDAEVDTATHHTRLTGAGRAVGTVNYMSPEQVRGQPADARSDIFSFGCVLYEIVAGLRAFRRDTPAETMTAILHEEPPEPSVSGNRVPTELSRIIRQCLAKNPNQRLQSARDLALGLRVTGSDPNLHSPEGARRPPRRRMAIAAVLLLIGAVGLCVYLLTLGGKTVTPEALAVLPFENLSGDPTIEYLSDGIAGHLINSFSRVRSDELKVRPFTSVEHYKRKKVDIPSMGLELNVPVVVTGKLHVTGDNLTIDVALVDTREEYQRWGDRYQGKLSAILDVQDKIARDVAAHLRLRLSGEEDAQLTKRYTDDTKAYLLYQEGVYHQNKFTPEGLQTAIEYYERALKEDQQYALAYNGLGRAYVLLGTLHRGPLVTHAQAKEYLLKGLEIDRTLPDPHSGLAAIYMFRDWDWPAAEQEVKQAIASPGVWSGYNIYGFHRAAHGRLDEALSALKRGQSLDPQASPRWHELAMCHNWRREHDQAIVAAKEALSLNPSSFIAYLELGFAYSSQGLHKEAIAALHTGLAASNGNPRVKGMLGRAYAAAGQAEEARRVLAELKEAQVRRFGDALAIGRIHAALEEKDEAFDWLQKALDERDSAVIWLRVDPAVDNLRSDPRFDGLLRQMRLVNETAARSEAVQSVGVLPFENLGGDPKTEFLSDGVAEQIIQSLSHVRRKDLKVRPFTSVSRYKRQKPDVAAAARELNVQVVVTGSLLQEQDDLTIRVAIANIHDERHVWGESYRGKLNDILDLQNQIARDVAANLRLHLSGEEDARLTKRYTDDPETHRLYLEGRHHLYSFTPQRAEKAKALFEQALQKNDTYAPALMGLGRYYQLQGLQQLGPRQTYEQTKRYLRQALAIDNDLAEGHAGMAMLYMTHDFDWPAAERESKAAYDLGSELPVYGFYLAAIGRLPEALAVLKRGYQLDPLSAARRNELAMCYIWLREYNEAVAWARKALDLQEDFWLAYLSLGTAYAQLGRHDEAIAELKKGLDTSQGHPRVKGMLGYAYAVAGKTEEARRVLDELKAAPQRRFGDTFAIALIHAKLDEKDEAFDWLGKAIDERGPEVFRLKIDPTMDNLRSDPRFDGLLRQIKLVD